MIGLLAPTAWAVDPTYQRIANYVGVPADLLYAMSQAESGRVQHGRFAPWPWTLNVAGQAQYFGNREAMFEALMQSLGRGQTRIDVGPMQLNWHWQFDEAVSPWRLTDPTVNIKLGAQVLKSQYEGCGDWWTAVGRYHRPAQTPVDVSIAERYRQRVRRYYESSTSEMGAVDAR